jgi:hypothetical protein
VRRSMPNHHATREDRDGHERRWDSLGHVWKEVDDGEAARDHHVGERRDPDKLGQLGHEDQDRKCVDEARNDRAGDEAHHPAEPQPSRDDLDDTHQDGGGEQILKTVLLDQRDHDNGGRRRGGRDHARPTAHKGSHAGDGEGGVEADLRIDARDHGEADRFRDEREGDDDAREHVATDVGEPLLTVV